MPITVLHRKMFNLKFSFAALVDFGHHSTSVSTELLEHGLLKLTVSLSVKVSLGIYFVFEAKVQMINIPVSNRSSSYSSAADGSHLDCI